MRIYFDVETVPSQAEDARDLVKAATKPPATYKKPESIAAWWETEAPAAIDEAYRKQSFDASVGELVSISWCDDDMPEASTVIRSKDENEGLMLRRFFGQLDAHFKLHAIRDQRGTELWEDSPFFIGHNAAFDLGFIWRRAIILGVRPMFKLPGPNAREGKDYACTMRAWAGWKDTISLDRLCKALKVQTPKGDLDGSKVFDAWLAGELDRIATYNRADVIATRECWRRITWETRTEAAA